MPTTTSKFEDPIAITRAQVRSDFVHLASLQGKLRLSAATIIRGQRAYAESLALLARLAVQFGRGAGEDVGTAGLSAVADPPGAPGAAVGLAPQRPDRPGHGNQA